MRKPLILGAAVALALSSAACTKKDDTTAATGSQGTAGATTTAAKTDTKDDFIKKADAVCKKYKDQLNALPTPKSADDIPAYFKDALKVAQDQLKELRGLGDPPADVDTWKKGLDTNQAIADRVQQLVNDSSTTPDDIMNDTKLDSLSKDGDALAKKFGLTVCGSESSSSSGGSSTTTSGSSKRSTTTTESDGGSKSSTTEQSSSGGGGNASATDCVEIASANLDLTTASDAASAQKAADTLNKWDPPSDVKDAIQVLVDGPGIQITDGGKTSQASKTISAWVSKVCKQA